ncbi:MAG: hypothetical protein K2M06_05020, partial [Muribaculaceae bacterium]|nr:hypothetical protein [Muribaculaceae bacterium]
DACLRAVQSSFRSPLIFAPSGRPAHSLRGLTVDFNFKSLVDEDVLRETFDTTYSDHNFAFLLPRHTDLPTGADDAPLAGCNKCFIALSRPEHDTFSVRAAIDPRMKGAVGNAIHCMNLLFGLHERTGLDLKPGE